MAVASYVKKDFQEDALYMHIRLFTITMSVKTLVVRGHLNAKERHQKCYEDECEKLTIFAMRRKVFRCIQNLSSDFM